MPFVQTYRQYNVNTLSSEGWDVCPQHLTHGEQQQCHTQESGHSKPKSADVESQQGSSGEHFYSLWCDPADKNTWISPNFKE